MIKTFLLLILFSIISCSKPKVVLICGDHICVNKDEAEQAKSQLEEAGATVELK